LAEHQLQSQLDQASLGRLPPLQLLAELGDACFQLLHLLHMLRQVLVVLRAQPSFDFGPHLRPLLAVFRGGLVAAQVALQDLIVRRRSRVGSTVSREATDYLCAIGLPSRLLDH
jgi:hypothetical protein